LHERFFVQQSNQAAQPAGLLLDFAVVAERAHRQRHGLHHQTDDGDDDEKLEEGETGVDSSASLKDPSSRCRH
jgi:hypothetical protein